MKLRPIRVTPPAVRIISTADAKAHLRVDSSAEDGLIDALVKAAESHIDGYSGVLGRCLINQVWKLSLASWPSGCMELPFPDVSAVTVTYFDGDNVEQTLDDANYELLELASASVLRWTDAFPAPSLYDRGDAINVTMTAGYGAAATDVPDAIIHAAKLLIGAWYENREQTVIGVSVGALPSSVAADALLNPYRRIGL